MTTNIIKENIIGMIEVMDEDTEVNLAREAVSMIFTMNSVSAEETREALGVFVEAVEKALQ